MAVHVLEKNSFYTALETQYSEKFQEAQKNLWLICVPCNKSLKEVPITKDLVDMHILKPSAFFKSHFVTTDPDNSRTFEMEDDNIKTQNGIIKILMEDTGYNDDYKPYKILIISKPLSLSSNKNVHNSTDIKIQLLSLNECTSYLMSFPKCNEVLRGIDKKIQVFNSSYVVLPQYLQDTARKLQFMSKCTTSEFLKHLAHKTPEEISKLKISAAVENYIMFHVHDKVFPVLKKFCYEQDLKLTKKLVLLYEAHFTPDQLGAREMFCCQTPNAVVELASLNSRKCPASKLSCLLKTLEHLNKDIETFLIETNYPVSNKDSPCLTSDDLIPLLVNIIVQARPQFFISNLHYIQNFCWENSPVDKLSFGLVTFLAAKEILISNEFELLKPSTRKIRKELSLEDLMKTTVDIQNNQKNSLLKPAQFQSPTDHLLENVTKMIEASTKELEDCSTNKDSATYQKKNKVTRQPQENVGFFLSSLQQSSLGTSYGQQN